MVTEKLYDFLNAHGLAVISTANTSGQAESALIGFGQTRKLEIIFGTENTSRKYQNIGVNPHVAFVIGWEHGETVQYEGVARQSDDSEIDVVRENYWSKTPDAERHHKNPNERYTPSWIRYTDVKSDPWDVTEWKPEGI